MKKALLAALCFIIVSLVLVNGTFALPDLDKVFADLTGLLGMESGLPQIGGAGTAVQVELVSEEGTRNLYPGGKVSSAFRVKNLGEGDVYFRLVYAIQYDEESWPHLDVRFTAGSGFAEHEWVDITIGSTPYRMKVFTYTEALQCDTLSPDVNISIAMDTSITSEQMSRFRSDFLKTQVLAVGAGDFTADKITVPANKTLAEAALDLALPLDKLSPF